MQCAAALTSMHPPFTGFGYRRMAMSSAARPPWEVPQNSTFAPAMMPVPLGKGYLPRQTEEETRCGGKVCVRVGGWGCRWVGECECV